MTDPNDDLLGIPNPLPHRATITGVGYALPRNAFDNEAVARVLGVEPGWIEPRTGVVERRWVAPDESILTMGEEATNRALEMAGLTVDDIDHIIFATYTFDRITPNAGPFLAEQMGFPKSVAAIDVNAACAGWLSGLKFGASLVEAGRAEHVLVIASDAISRYTGQESRGGIPVMGDGAGASILSRQSAERPGAIGDITIHADGSHAEMISGHHSTERAWMRGQETYMVAVAELVRVTKEVLEKADLTRDDPDLYVFHQANARILKAVGARLDLPLEKSVSYLSHTGNISAATIPMALTRAREDGKLKQGDLVCTAAIGAGYVWGGGLLRWGIPDPE